MHTFRRHEGGAGPRVLAALLVFALAVTVAALRVGGSRDGSGPRASGNHRNDAAPEFSGITSWLNSEPLTVAGLRGRVVLVDFWTFSCVNCIRTLPGLRALDGRYRSSGLEIVGIHSPEFTFEKEIDNVRDAVERLSITWAVGLDNAMATWRAFRNNYWPHVYLIDRAGRLRYDKIGEGDESELEAQIRTLLAEGSTTALPAPVSLPEYAADSPITPEVYAGYERGEPNGTIAGDLGYSPNQVVTYPKPSARALAAARADGRIFLEGPWTARPQFLHARGPGRVYLPFHARDVFMVASAEPAARFRVLVDGKPVAFPGDAVRSGEVGVGRSDLYHLVRLPSAGRHLLVIEAGAGFALYTFTFG